MDFINSVIGFKGIEKTKNKDIKPNVPVKSKQDTFEKETAQASGTELKTYKAAPKTNIRFGKKEGFCLGAGIAAAAGVIALCVQGAKNGNFQKTISLLKEEISSNNRTIRHLQDEINGLSEERSIQDETVNELVVKLSGLRTRLEDIAAENQNSGIKTDFTEQYREMIKKAGLNYDPISDAPKQTKESKKIFNLIFRKIDAPDSSKKPDEYTKGLISRLKSGEDIIIPQAKKSNTREDIIKASLESTDSSLFKIGQYEPAAMKLNYGKRTNWSNEKISRDIMQNFYDANNHTLDGVGVAIESVNGGYKVRITGNGVYNCAEMLELGSGSKLAQSPYNAGGFGEGSRIVVANLLGQGKTSAVRYGSADWQIEFAPKGGSIVRKIEKTDNPSDGNFMEFTTNDQGLVETLLKSINYFKNSNNPDFSDLTYESKDFAFRILSPGEKGNLYLTQRFECGAADSWDESCEGLNLIFNRKPDSEEFKNLTGKLFRTGRDRAYLTTDDIYDLTRYFCKDMSDEELLTSVIKTQNFWSETRTPFKEDEIKAFMKSLIKTAQERGLSIDFKEAKLCEATRYISDDVKKYLQSEGYAFVDPSLELSKIGLQTSSQVLDILSAHTPLKPTQREIQRLNILEKATEAIQEGLQNSYAVKFKKYFEEAKPFITFDNDISCRILIGKLKKSGLFNNDAFLKKYENADMVSKEEIMEFTHDFTDFLSRNSKESSLNDEEGIRTLAEILKTCIRNKEGREKEFLKLMENLSGIQTISKSDIKKPRFVFDRKKEFSTTTLGEAIIDEKINGDRQYMGHWIDRSYLNEGSFYELVATWLHEITHKSGGDGTSAFTYKLTDLIEQLTEAVSSNETTRLKLSALEKVFNET